MLAQQPRRLFIDAHTDHLDGDGEINSSMAPSASKQKRLAEKAAKQASKGKGAPDDSTTGTSTPDGSVNGSATNTPLTSLSVAGSKEDLTSMAKLQIATDR